MGKSQHRMKQQDNHSPIQPNTSTKYLRTSNKKKISNNELQKTIVKMINGPKEETQKLVSDLKEDVNKQLNKLKENTNKWINETKKAMQDMKDEIHKDMGTLKINQSDKQLNIPNKNLNQDLNKQSGAS
jgi:SOS response regulatory protein OraA/RecX